MPGGVTSRHFTGVCWQPWGHDQAARRTAPEFPVGKSPVNQSSWQTFAKCSQLSGGSAQALAIILQIETPFWGVFTNYYTAEALNLFQVPAIGHWVLKNWPCSEDWLSAMISIRQTKGNLKPGAFLKAKRGRELAVEAIKPNRSELGQGSQEYSAMQEYLFVRSHLACSLAQPLIFFSTMGYSAIAVLPSTPNRNSHS